MITPIAFPEISIDCILGLFHHFPKIFLFLVNILYSELIKFCKKSTRCKWFGQKGKQLLLFFLGKQIKNITCFFLGKCICYLFNCKRIVSIYLNQAVELHNTFRSHIWCEKGFTSSILIHIPEISISLWIKFRKHTEIIIVSFQIPMLSGINMKNLSAGQLDRESSPKYIIHISIGTVCIKLRHCCFGFYYTA